MRLQIVGSGFAGLACAYAAAKSGMPVDIWEKAPVPGGLLQTTYADEGIVEAAANGFICSESVLQLFADLKIKPEFANRSARRRYIFWEKPKRWPLSMGTTAKLAWRLGRRALTGGLGRLIPESSSAQSKASERSVADWGRSFVNDEFVDRLLSPGLRGVFGVSADKLDSELVLGPLMQRRRQAAGYRGTVAPQAGMQALFNAFIPFLAARGCNFYLQRNFKVPAQFKDPIILTGSMRETGLALAQAAPEVSRRLINHPKQSLTSVTLFYAKAPTDLPGFGCLFPEPQGFFAMGVLFNSGIFANRSQLRSETYIIGGNEALGLADSELLRRLAQDRTRLYGLSESQLPHYVQSFVHRWSEALPVYNSDLKKILSDMVLPEGLHVLGNFTGNLSLSRMLDQAKELVAQIREGST